MAALVSAQVLFGLHYLVARLVVAEISPANWALLRAAVSGLILLAAVGWSSAKFPRDRETLKQFAGLSLLGVAINQYLFIEGIQRTTPAHSALINTSIPVLVMLLAVIFGRERPTATRLAGIGITLVGVLLLIGPEQLDWKGRAFHGDLLTLGNCLSYSFFLILGKPIVERQRTLPATALLLCFGALWLVPIGLPGMGSLQLLGPGAVRTETWMLAGFIVVGPTIGAYALNTFALRRVDSSLVAIFTYLQPLIGAGLSIGLGFEALTPRLLAAGATILGGILITLRAP